MKNNERYKKKLTSRLTIQVTSKFLKNENETLNLGMYIHNMTYT